MLNFDNLAFLSADKGGGVVAIAEVVAGLACLFLHISLTMHALGVHGHECLHAVATVNVEYLCHRAKAVSGVYVATVFLVVLHAPVQVFLV